MILAGLPRFLRAYRSVIVGLRTGQIGLANASLRRVIDYLSDCIAHLSSAQMGTLPAQVAAMLQAKENNDTVALADLLQFELPKAMPQLEVSPLLLNIDLIAGLIDIARDFKADNDPKRLVEDILRLSERRQCETVGLYFAPTLYKRRELTALKTILDSRKSMGAAPPATSYFMSLLEAHEGRFDIASRLMESAYQDSPTLMNGYIRLGWLSGRQKNWKRALALAEKDEKPRRHSAAWAINLALIFGHNGKFDQAVELIKAAYEKKDDICNAYARLGWLKALDLDWTGANELMVRDAEQDRLTPRWQIAHTLVKVHLDRWDEAFDGVQHAYADDPDLKDGFAKLGWHGFLMDRDPFRFSELVARDQAEGRLSETGQLFSALALAASGNAASAAAIVNHEYRNNADRRGWLSSLGWLVFRHIDRIKGCELMTQDHVSGRMANTWLPSYAIAVAGCDLAERANDVLDEVSSKDCTTQGKLYVGHRFRPDATYDLPGLRKAVADAGQLRD